MKLWRIISDCIFCFCKCPLPMQGIHVITRWNLSQQTSRFSFYQKLLLQYCCNLIFVLFLTIGPPPRQVLHSSVCSGGVLLPLPPEGRHHYRGKYGGRAEGQHGCTEGGSAGHLCEVPAPAAQQAHSAHRLPTSHCGPNWWVCSEGQLLYTDATSGDLKCTSGNKANMLILKVWIDYALSSCYYYYYIY